MSGHSKWSTIKRKKAAEDAKKGKIFTKLTRELTTAARIGGGDPESNARLRQAVDAARAHNMPLANIERAIKKGTGELQEETYEEVIYEGYGPAGVAIMISSLTDNKNRTVSEVRHVFSRNSGNLGEVGCVNWIFEKKGIFEILKGSIDADKIMELALELGVEDIVEEGHYYRLSASYQAFEKIKEILKRRSIQPDLAEVSFVPKMTVRVKGKDAELVLRLVDQLEELDDVQHVYANFDIEDTELLKIAAT